jgi:hypothetical protein
MSGTDQNLIREAIAQFQPRRRPRFQNLQPCREFIIELRGKGASCEAIAELLTRYGVKTSRTMVNEFVRELRQTKKSKRSRPESNPPSTPTTRTALVSTHHEQPGPVPVEIGQARARGPRIAKVELLKPVTQNDQAA